MSESTEIPQPVDDRDVSGEKPESGELAVISDRAVNGDITVSVQERLARVGTRPAVPPCGSIFALGWLMAELFDPRRRLSVTARQPAFSQVVQLQQVRDLTPDQKLVFLAAELSELIDSVRVSFPGLVAPAAKVTEQTDKVKAFVMAGLAERIAVAQRSAGQLAGSPAEVDQQAGTAGQFSQLAFEASVIALNQAVLDAFGNDPERLSAYQLGLALSDLVWLPYIPEPGADPDPAAARPSALFAQFSRPQLATLQTLISGAGTQLPPTAAAAVSRSLENWADWLDVNMAKLKDPGADRWATPHAAADTVLHALRVQGSVWRSALVGDPEVTTNPGMGAWVQAATAISTATRKVVGAVLVRFWWLVVLGLVVLGLLLWLIIANLSGAGEVWTSLAAVTLVLGSGGAGLFSGVSGAFRGIGFEIWSAAKQDAAAWNITWLPPLTQSTRQRTALDSRGTPTPQLRKHLDIR